MAMSFTASKLTEIQHQWQEPFTAMYMFIKPTLCVYLLIQKYNLHIHILSIFV